MMFASASVRSVCPSPSFCPKSGVPARIAAAPKSSRRSRSRSEVSEAKAAACCGSASALGGLAVGALGLHLGLGALALARLAVVGVALGILVLYDLRERRIPNRVVGPAILACSVLSVVEGVRASGVVGGAVLVAVILLVALAQPAWVGMGDAKLAMLLLAGLHAATPLALLFGVELAAVIALAVALRRGRLALSASLPLAPFMAAGSLLALLL